MVIAPPTSRYSITRLLAVLEKREVDPATLDLTIFSFMTDDYEWIKERVSERGYMIAGGPHPSGDPEGTKRFGFDLVVVGEGESVIEMIAKGERPSGIIKGEPRRLEEYPPFSIRFKRFGPIELIRGCPHRCTFCQTPKLFGPVRKRPVDDVIYWMRRLSEFGIRDVRFIAPDGLGYGVSDLKRIFEAKSPGQRIFFGSFPSEIRPDSVTEEAIGLIKRYCSNRRVIIGAQAGSDEMLKKIRRGHTTGDVIQAVRVIRGFDLIPIVDMIFGLPDEERFLPETIEFLDEITGLGAIIHAHYLKPLPRTELAGITPCDTGYLDRHLGRLSARGELFGRWR
ncbi:MAG TPA: TIGR04013 family B12-binding domain/radical SAM domain-containing protein [bacterium (Candidatus Stahlbacteria)]|nr:TIGR04013 family B12-binding domain/radical SAM domain-containing protein [Candidatus Stahlbacteria bacterium]